MRGLKLGFTPVWMAALGSPFGAARRPRSLAGRVPPFGGVHCSGRTKRRASKTRPPQSTAVSELERTKGTRLLNRNIA